MSKFLLIVAGVLNLLFGFFHIYLGYSIHHLVDVPTAIKGLMESLNVGGGLMIFFLAFTCLLFRKEMLGTPLGGAVLALGALLYLSRAMEELFWFTFTPAIFYSCLVIGLIHLVLMFQVRVAKEAA